MQEKDEVLEGSFRAEDSPPDFSPVLSSPSERVVFVPVERVVERHVIVERPVYRTLQAPRTSRFGGFFKAFVLFGLLASGCFIVYLLFALLRPY